MAKEKLNPKIAAMVDNESKLTRKTQLDAYDGCARMRPIWDELASKYDAVLTPSVPDEATVGTASTGDAVCTKLDYLFTSHLLSHSYFTNFVM